MGIESNDYIGNDNITDKLQSLLTCKIVLFSRYLVDCRNNRITNLIYIQSGLDYFCLIITQLYIHLVLITAIMITFNSSIRFISC